MEIEFFCPYCGKQSKLTVKNALPSDIICDLCGSSIIDQAKEALQLFPTESYKYFSGSVIPYPRELSNDSGVS